MVTITGTGFTGVTAVNFGMTPATSETFDSDTSITAESPAGTGAVECDGDRHRGHIAHHA